jgi:CO dehydrogenase/acetyl-CoA synthase beta subunit
MIDTVNVRVILDEHIPPSFKKAGSEYKNNRAKHLRELAEENTDFCMCARCRSFALDHACVIKPERQPICDKSYDEIRILIIVFAFNLQFDLRLLGTSLSRLTF